MSIDRRSLVTRHSPNLTGADPASPLSVGNGAFAFSADCTGFQTLYDHDAGTTPHSSAFVACRAAMALLWSNLVASYQGAMTDEIGITQLPTGENNALPIQVSQHLAVNAASEHIETAVLFINFFVTNRGIPSSPVVREAIAGDATPVEAMLYTYLNTAASRAIPQGHNLPNDQEFVNTLQQIGQSVSFGQISREEGAQQIYDLIHRLMVK